MHLKRVINDSTPLCIAGAAAVSCWQRCALAASVARAQNQAAAGSAPAASAAAQPAKPSSDNAWLAKTAKLYYSSAKAGLTGFDCAIHPDWRALFASASKGEAVPEDDPRIAPAEEREDYDARPHEGRLNH